jgi:hypothetical protein
MAFGGKKKKIVTFSLLAVAVVVVVGTIIASSMGYLTVRLSIGKNAAGSERIVCGSDIIKKFNDVSGSVVKSESEFAERQKKIVSVADEVIKMNGSHNDPTCAYIMLSGSIANSDADKSKSYLEQLTKLVDEGKYINNNIDGVLSITALSSQVEALQARPADNSSERGEG